MDKRTVVIFLKISSNCITIVHKFSGFLGIMEYKLIRAVLNILNY